MLFWEGLKMAKIYYVLDFIIKILSQLILVFWYPSNSTVVRNCAPKLKIYINTDINC